MRRGPSGSDSPRRRSRRLISRCGSEIPAARSPRFAEQLHAELIVMPSHGRTGLSRLFIGSVAERVVRLAHCPVLILK